MAETAANNRTECQACRGSGTVDDAPCFACKGKGWFESTTAEPEEQDDFDFGVLGDELGADAPDSVFDDSGDDGDDVLGGGGDGGGGGDDVLGGGESGSVLDAGAPFTGRPSSGQSELRSRGPLDPQKELEELHEQLDRTKQRINLLESLVAGGLGGEKKSKAKQHAGRPESTEDLLKLLGKSRLLDPKHYRAAQLMAMDPKIFAKRLMDKKMLSEWQAGQLLKGRSEFLLGKYKLIRVIGAGSMGVVFLANHITMNRRAALKIYSRQLAQNSPFLDRFLAQTRALGGLNHRNLVQVFNADRLGDSFYLVMEYVKGRNLKEVVGAEGPLKFAVCADYICQAATGLHHLHTSGILHQGVRPAKILIDHNNVIKLAHAGLGGKLINYRAPECLGTGGKVDSRSEVFSLGCTLYFLLTAHPAFPAELSSQELHKCHRGEVKSIQAFRPGIPKPLLKVCEKMMARKPDDRFPTCQAVVETVMPLIRHLLKADLSAG